MLVGGKTAIEVNNKRAGIKRTVQTNGSQRGTVSHWEKIWKVVLPQGDGDTLLDAGCGEHIWHATDWEIHRCDNWQDYENRGHAESIGAEVDFFDLNNRWPYQDGQFAGVLAVDVIEHLENLYYFFREAMRVSRDFVIVSTPNTESDFSRRLFFKHGFLWGFIPDEIAGSHHLNPVFEWQMRIVEKRSGWKIDNIAFANVPFKVPMTDMLDYLNAQPTRKGRIFRFRKP